MPRGHGPALKAAFTSSVRDSVESVCDCTGALNATFPQSLDIKIVNQHFFKRDPCTFTDGLLSSSPYVAINREA